MYKHYQLKNGANVLLVPQSDTASATTLVMYPLGSRYEPEKLRGVSHYIEHLMFKGTTKRKNTQILTREIDRLGAAYNAFTGKEYTGYYIKADATYLETSLDILSDMLLNSLFDPKEMEREKGPIVEELRMYKDNPMMNIDNIFEELMYNGCPLGRDIGGTEKHVMGFKRPDVLLFRDTYYSPKNMTIVVAGAVSDHVEDMIQNYFGTTKKQRPIGKTFKPACFGSVKKEDRLRIEKKETDQVQLMLGFPGFAHRHKLNPVATVMSSILGGTMSSRLFIQIRERRGLAYHVRSGTENFRDTGHIFVRAGLEAKNVNKAIQVIQDELKKLEEKKVTKRELDDAKTHIRGALTLSLEDSSAQANWYANQALFAPKILTPEDELKKIDTVSTEQIQALAKHVFKINQMRVAMIGNLTKEKVRF